jgi:hypothetical protein
LVETHEGKDNLEDIGVDGKMILKWVFKKWDRVMDVRNLERNGDMWRALLLAVMNFGFPLNEGKYLSS